MKKIVVGSLFMLLFMSIFAQDEETRKHSEYWYGSFKLSLINNISLPANENPNVFINSPYGHMPVNASPFSYTPGINCGFYYNFDLKNNMAGLVVGLEFQNMGFSFKYKTKNPDYKYSCTNQFRANIIDVPVYLKLWNSDIYKRQSYVFAGLVYEKFIDIYNIQMSSWNTILYTRKLSDAEKIRSSWQSIAGLNYDIYFVSVRYSFSNFLNKDYMIVSDVEGTIRPYSNINFFNSLYVEAGLNIPLTRWLTTKYWTAEKIRRFFKPKR